MKTLDLYLNEQLKNEEFRKEWEENQPEMDIIRAMADARISQNLTQKELAERTGINQADMGKRAGVSRQTISLIERGDYSPSVTLALKLAKICQVTVEDIFSYTEEENDE